MNANERPTSSELLKHEVFEQLNEQFNQKQLDNQYLKLNTNKSQPLFALDTLDSNRMYVNLTQNENYILVFQE
jgi:hypothetical protein